VRLFECDFMVLLIADWSEEINISTSLGLILAKVWKLKNKLITVLIHTA